LSGPAREEEGPVVNDGAADLRAVLVQLDVRLGVALRVSVELVGIQSRVAEELEHRSVNLVGAAAGGHIDRRTAVAPFLGGGIVSGHAVFLNVVGSEAVEVRHRVGNGGFVGLDAVYGDVEGAVPRTVDVNARA